jgi:hypothetical protein
MTFEQGFAAGFGLVIDVLIEALKASWFIWVPVLLIGLLGFVLRIVLIEVGARRGWNLYWVWWR